MTTKNPEHSTKTLDVCSPFDRSLIKSLALQMAADAEQMLETADRLFKDRDNWLEQTNALPFCRNSASWSRPRLKTLHF